MGNVQSVHELMRYISKMNRENSVCQFSIPGKGTFTLVLQEEDDKEPSIQDDASANPALDQMMKESKKQYEKDLGHSTKGLLDSLSSEDYIHDES
ncbi:hypothetical protein ACE1TF_18860 [Geomicrobium sp. JSM 1781026]|uniref:hypothetical protein n=1 Tax=Geomicrobium sp. JSM 1781026 TaxID=3344580 RepID=UPI0035BEC7D1